MRCREATKFLYVGQTITVSVNIADGQVGAPGLDIAFKLASLKTMKRFALLVVILERYGYGFIYGAQSHVETVRSVTVRLFRSQPSGRSKLKMGKL